MDSPPKTNDLNLHTWTIWTVGAIAVTVLRKRRLQTSALNNAQQQKQQPGYINVILYGCLLQYIITNLLCSLSESKLKLKL